MTMEEMQRLLERQQSRTDIMNLMGRYQYYHTGGQMSRIGRELFAWWLPDARCEYGPLGVFGAKKSLEFFDAMTELFTGGTGACHPGLLEIHQITTPVLEVAEDNQTAKGMWMSTGAILMLHDEGAGGGPLLHLGLRQICRGLHPHRAGLAGMAPARLRSVAHRL